MLDLSTTNKPYATLTDAATVSVDMADGDIQYLSTANNRTIDIPSNRIAGGRLVIAIKNTSGGTVTPTFTTSGTGAYRYGSDIASISAIAAGKTDYYTFVNHPVDDRMDMVAVVKGY